MLHNTIINLLTRFSVPIDDLPLIMKSRLSVLDKEETQNESLSYRK